MALNHSIINMQVSSRSIIKVSVSYAYTYTPLNGPCLKVNFVAEATPLQLGFNSSLITELSTGQVGLTSTLPDFSHFSYVR